MKLVNERGREATLGAVCHWCRIEIVGVGGLTLPEHSRYPALPQGTGVRVCGPGCPQRPASAPVVARLEWETV